MKKRGFTLIELICAIAILAILSTITITVVVKRINESKEKAYDTLIESIELAAKNYVINNEESLSSYANNDWINIPIETLINSNSFNKSLINPKTKEPIPSTNYVYVTRNYNGKITSTYDENQLINPKMQLIGSFNIYLKKGDVFTDPEVIIISSTGENLSSSVIKSGTVNSNIAGVYVLTYSYNNISITRNVIVK